MNRISPLSVTNYRRPAVKFAGAPNAPVSQPSPSPANNNNVRFSGMGKVALNVGAALSALSLIGGYGFFAITDSNRPGKSSVEYNGRKGGHQDEVNGPGMVVLDWHAALPVMAGVHNAAISTNDQFVIETIRPSTQEQMVIPAVRVAVDFRVNKDYIKTLLADQLGHVSNTSINSPTTTFAKVDDPNVQKVYNLLIRTALASTVQDLSTTRRGENYHQFTDFLTLALNKGFNKYPIQKIDNDGEMKTVAVKDIPSLQEQVGPLVTINKVYVLEEQLPQDLVTKLETQAEQPLLQEIANLKKDLSDTELQRNQAFEKVAAAENKEAATQQAKLEALKETGTIEVATHDAETAKIKQAAEKSKLATIAEGDKEANDIDAKAQESRAKILAEANIYDAQTRAEADTLVAKAKGNAKAEEARLKGTPYQKYPELLQLDALEGSSQIISALANNPNATIDYFDPQTGLKIEVLNIGSGGGPIDPKAVLGAVVGQKVANKSTTPAPAPEAPPAQK